PLEPESTEETAVPTTEEQPLPATPTATASAPSAPAATGRTHTVQRGETLNIIARMYGTTASAIAQLNGIVNPNLIYAGQVLRIPDGNVLTPTPDLTQPVTYRVQRGDTLYRIAVRNGTTVAEL